jgi:plasmid stabilization system protein ParE
MVAAVAEGATHAAHLQEQAQHQQNKPWQGAMPCAAAVDQQLPVVANSSVYPRLLPTYPDTVDSCQQQLCEVLLIAPAEAQLLMLNSTEAAALPRQQLEANWAQLQRLLPVSRQQLLQAMLQLPDLLLQPQQVVSIRLAEAAEVLQIPLTQLQRQQKPTTPQLHWRLLLLSPQELEERLVQLLQLLDLQEQQQKQQQRRPEQAEQLSRKLRQAVVLMLVQEPRLLSVEQAQLVSSVEALEQVRCNHSMYVAHTVTETLAGDLLVAFAAERCSRSTVAQMCQVACSSLLATTASVCQHTRKAVADAWSSWACSMQHSSCYLRNLQQPQQQ